MQKPNRAHYILDSTHTGKWKPTGEELCVFHARRISRWGERLRALAVSNRGMSRPVERPCTKCQEDDRRCEHDYYNTYSRQHCECPHQEGDTCGRDTGGEMGGSWWRVSCPMWKLPDWPKGWLYSKSNTPRISWSGRSTRNPESQGTRRVRENNAYVSRYLWTLCCPC